MCRQYDKNGTPDLRIARDGSVISEKIDRLDLAQPQGALGLNFPPLPINTIGADGQPDIAWGRITVGVDLHSS